MTPSNRIEEFERRLRDLERDLVEIRNLVAAGTEDGGVESQQAAVVEAQPERTAEWGAVPEEAPETAPPPNMRWFEQSHDFQFEPSDLLGARALAWAGGVVTVLGVVLFFALAVNRGWIGPGARVGLGGVASALVFGGGLWLRRRFGETYSALSAVGAGIAGAFVTLLAAGPRYDLLPDWASLGIAAAVAGLALFIALRWSSEFVAGLGLVGASLVQIPIAWDGGLTTTGTAFGAFVFAASAIVAVAERWQVLVVASSIAVVPQVLVLAGQHYGDAPAGPLAVAAGCAAILLAAGIGLHLRSDGELAPFQASAVLGAAALVCFSAALLFRGETREGVTFLVVAGVYGALAALFFPRDRTRDIGVLLFAVALAVAAVGVADLLSGASLGIAWAAEAAVLAWLARRVGDIRFQLGSLAYLVLAIGHAIVVDTPPRHLFVERAHPAAGIAGLLAAIVAAAVFAERSGGTWSSRQAGGIFRGAQMLFDRLRSGQTELRFASGLVAGVGVVYAASLGMLELPFTFAWNHVAVTVLMAFVPLGVLVVGLARQGRLVELGGAVGLVLALLKVLAFDIGQFESPQRPVMMLLVGLALLLAGFFFQRLPELTRLDPLAALSIGISVPLGVIAPFELLDGRWHAVDRTGAALLAVAGVYAVLAALVFRRAAMRDLATLQWAIALGVAALAAGLLFAGTPRALVWAAAAVAIVWLSIRTGEQRFHVAAAVYVALATVDALVVEAPPTDFFESNRHPAAGAGAVAGAAAAALVLGLVVRIPAVLRISRSAVLAAAGVLATYAVSLVILELFEVGGGRVETKFERGHATVSAVWGAMGLLLLYLGLTRRKSLRLAGFALFGVTLAKIFLYDLSTLSPVARALSFLAVGAGLLLGGFFYQRLSAGPAGEGEAPGR